MTTSLIFDLFVEGKDFIIYCDAWHSSLGSILMHEKNLITYTSWKNKLHEKNYPTDDLDLAVMVFAFKI